MKLLLAVLSLIYGSNAFLYGKTSWKGLESPWSANLVAGFSHRPRDLNTDSMGWTLKENFCSEKTQFLGKAYWNSGDPTLVVLFDVNGYVAGIQNWLDASKYTPPTSAIGKSMQKYNGYWVMTVYFVDPSIICNGGRTAAQFKTDGTGDRMLIQIGANPLQSSSVMNIPRDQNEITSTQWTKGKCFYTMGQHYWYNLSSDMDCNDFFPFCILYNKGQLDAFCFASNANLDDSNFDSPHPSPSVLAKFMDPVPKCMNANSAKFSKYSTIHVYMTEDPRTQFC